MSVIEAREENRDPLLSTTTQARRSQLSGPVCAVCARVLGGRNGRGKGRQAVAEGAADDDEAAATQVEEGGSAGERGESRIVRLSLQLRHRTSLLSTRPPHAHVASTKRLVHCRKT